MYRIVFYIIYFIIFVVINAVSGGRYGYRSYRRRSILYGYDNNYSYTLASDIIQARIKRFFATRRAKKYITKYRYSFSLKNKNTTLIYNYAEESIACMNILDRQQNFKVRWDDYKDNNGYSYTTMLSDSVLKNSFTELFNRLCIMFNENTIYEDVLSEIQESYNVNIEIKHTPPIKQSNKPAKSAPVYVDEYFSGDNAPKKRININEATLEEIQALPGINIILAKKIIKLREEKAGFKSNLELYDELKIKKHFQKQLDKLIYTDTEKFPSNMKKSLYNYDVKRDEEVDIVYDDLETDKPANTEPAKKNNDRIIDF